MIEEVLQHRGTILVRRLLLAPGEAMPWHRDPFHRVTIVLSGDALAIEFQDGGPSERFEIAAGQVDWDEPAERTHRAVNVGEQPYEEVAVFFLDRADAVPQPRIQSAAASAAWRARDLCRTDRSLNTRGRAVTLCPACIGHS